MSGIELLCLVTPVNLHEIKSLRAAATALKSEWTKDSQDNKEFSFIPHGGISLHRGGSFITRES